MNLNFKQIERDSVLESLASLLETLVMTKTSQYEVITDSPLTKEYFEDEENYTKFFKAFAEYANPHWVDIWDFSKVPFRKPSDKITGLISIIRSGGAYTPDKTLEESEQIEEEFRFRFKGIWPELIIFNMVEYDFSDRTTKSYGLGDDFFDLKRISPWFLQIAWDNLIFIINPSAALMYVIAFTDED